MDLLITHANVCVYMYENVYVKREVNVKEISNKIILTLVCLMDNRCNVTLRGGYIFAC